MPNICILTHGHGTTISISGFEFSRKSDLVVKKGEEMRFNCSIKPTGNCFRDYNVTDIVIRKVCSSFICRTVKLACT